MSWRRAFSVTLPGVGMGVPVASEASSLLVADGWGVAFVAQTVRRLDVATGRELGRVRTATAIRAMTTALDGTLVWVGDQELFRHDATTLARLATYDRRVPRYAHHAVDCGDVVVLAAPRSLVEYGYATGKTKRVATVPAAALGTIGDHVVALLTDGTVHARSRRPADSDGWKRIGDFGGPHYIGFIDGEIGALPGAKPAPHDEQGRPQSVSWPRANVLRRTPLAPWQPRTIPLPRPALTVGRVGGEVVAVDFGFAMRVDAPPVLPDELPGAFLTITPHGILTTARGSAETFDLMLYKAESAGNSAVERDVTGR